MTKLLKIIAASTVALYMQPCTYMADGFSVLPNEWVGRLTDLVPF